MFSYNFIQNTLLRHMLTPTNSVERVEGTSWKFNVICVLSESVWPNGEEMNKRISRQANWKASETTNRWIEQVSKIIKTTTAIKILVLALLLFVFTLHTWICIYATSDDAITVPLQSLITNSRIHLFIPKTKLYLSIYLSTSALNLAKTPTRNPKKSPYAPYVCVFVCLCEHRHHLHISPLVALS